VLLSLFLGNVRSGARKLAPNRVLEHLKQSQCLKTMLCSIGLFRILPLVVLSCLRYSLHLNLNQVILNGYSDSI